MEDEQIVRLYWNRDEAAIPATAEKYGAYCTTVARNILGNLQDAEECVNDAYLQAWNAMPPHRPRILSTFLGKLTRNLALNRYKHLAAEKRGGGEAAVVLEELAECVSGVDDIERELNRRELLGAINGFLRTLPDRKRNIFVLRYWYAHPVGDIASRYGMTPGAVSMTLNRLRSQLHGYLLERGFDL